MKTKLEAFNKQLDRLNEAYRGYYTKERAKVIFSVVCDLPPEWLAKQIDKALWSDHPPKLDWFQTIASRYKSFDEKKPVELERRVTEVGEKYIQQLREIFRLKANRDASLFRDDQISDEAEPE